MIEIAVMVLVLACLGVVGGIITGYFDWFFLHKNPEHKIWISSDHTPTDFGIIGRWERTGVTDSNGFREWRKV